MRHSIVIEAPGEGQDSFGQLTEVWTTYHTCRASIEPLRGREYFEAQKIGGEQQVRFRIRYRDGITSKMRINYNGRIFNIVSPPIDPRERHRELQIMAVEKLD
jgi:SPP1 family predicted phage head-tail adaptor